MKCKITTLTENCVYGRKLQAEHGLCLYVELPDAVVLFDTGLPTSLSGMHACCMLTCNG